jgi:hypothetical protein
MPTAAVGLASAAVLVSEAKEPQSPSLYVVPEREPVGRDANHRSAPLAARRNVPNPVASQAWLTRC